MKLYTYSSETDVLEITWDMRAERRVREEVGFDLFLDPEGDCIGVRIPNFYSTLTGGEDWFLHEICGQSELAGVGLQHILVQMSNLVSSHRAFFLHDSHFGFVLQNWNEGEIPEGTSPPQEKDERLV